MRPRRSAHLVERNGGSRASTCGYVEVGVLAKLLVTGCLNMCSALHCIPPAGMWGAPAGYVA